MKSIFAGNFDPESAVLKDAGITVDEHYYRAHIAGRSNDQVFAAAFPARSIEEHRARAVAKTQHS